MIGPNEHVATVKELAAEVNIGTNTICCIRKAGRILNDPIPNYATAGDIIGWLKRWPMFVAKDWEGTRWQERLGKYNATGRRGQRECTPSGK